MLPRGGSYGLHALDTPAAPPTPVAPLPLEPPFAFDLRGEQIAFVDHGGKRVSVFDIERDGALSPRWSASYAPEGFSVRCLRLHEEVVYLGGSRKRARGRAAGASCLYVVDEQGWRELSEPEGGTSKHIDGLAISGEQLVAVDDLVRPKWNFVFDIKQPPTPQFLSKSRLPAHISYEQVEVVASDDRWLALWSRGINHGNMSTHLCLLSMTDLRERATIGFRWSWKTPDQPATAHGLSTQSGDCRDIALLHERLFIILDSKLYCLALPDAPETAAYRASHKRNRRALAVVDHPMSGAPVLRLTLSSDGRRLFLIHPPDVVGPAWTEL